MNHYHTPARARAGDDGATIEDCACGAARVTLATGYVSTWHACASCSSAVRAGECEAVR